MRTWTDIAWSLAWRTLPAPASAFLAMLLPGEHRAEYVVGLLVAAAVSQLSAARALHVAGWALPPGTHVATGLGLLTTVGAALAVAARADEPEAVLALVVLGLPHVALAGLAWPGWRGLVLRVAVATAAVVPAGLLAFWSGLLMLAVLGPLAIAVGFAVGHLLVAFAGTAVAGPVALRPRDPLAAPAQHLVAPGPA